MTAETPNAAQSPTSPARASLGLFGEGPGEPASLNRAAAPQHSAGERDSEQRRRAARRQSEDVMRTMRSLDRQYGRRRRLNTDRYERTASDEALGASKSPRSTSGKGAGRARLPLSLGDPRAQFAPLCAPQTAAVLAARQPHASAEAESAATVPARLAQQLMQIAGRFAPQAAGRVAAVRPRASMPLISGAPRPPQRTRSHAARRPRDDLAGALTMKSVEIRGGRIVLDDPSSSDDSASEADAAQRQRLGSAASAAGARPSVGSSVCSADDAWADALRQRWYARRCLGLRQPFASVHRLARAEHDARAPFPLLNDVRRVVHETRACEFTDEPPRSAGAAVDVLLCTDAIVFGSAQAPLRVVEFGDDLRVRVDGASVLIGSGTAQLRVRFAADDAAGAWARRVEHAHAQYALAQQDLRLDEEDFVDRPPLPLLLARGRSSIAGAQAGVADALAGSVSWVPDSETAVCMVCRTTAFSMMVRRHHCRACGLVICYRCSAAASGRRHCRLCVRCSALHRADALDFGPRPSPSLQTLGRRAPEFPPPAQGLPEPDPEPTAAAAVRPVARRKASRRPISTIFPVESTDG